MDTLESLLSGTRPFLVYFGTSLGLLAVFTAIYTVVTPYHELTLIRGGNKAAAIALAGAILGFVIPASKAIAQSSSVLDMVVWAIVAFVAQVIAYFVAAMLVPQLRKTIVEDRISSGILIASLSIAIGILNAASMTL